MVTEYQNPDLLDAQVPKDLPDPKSFSHITGPIIAPTSIEKRLAHFPEGVYRLEAEDHLVKLMKVLLGDAGAGQLRKRLLYSRFGAVLTGARFLDLDRFWGAIFGIRRNSSEVLDFDPAIDLATEEEWAEQEAKDASYRARIREFAWALHYGATPVGMELVAEALLAVDCDILEGFVQADHTFQTYSDLEAFNYLDLEGYTYGQLDGSDQIPGGDVLAGNPVSSMDRETFVIRPKRTITEEERYVLLNVIDKLKPVSARAVINELGFVSHQRVHPRGYWASSEYWGVRAKITPTEFHPRPEPSPPVKPPGETQGVAFSYLFNVLGVNAYAIEDDGTIVPENQETVPFTPEYSVTYSAGRAMQLISVVHAGRGVSEGVLAGRPFPAYLNQSPINAGRFFGGNFDNTPGLGTMESLLSAGINGHNLYIDGLPIGSVLDLINHTRPDPQGQFWASQKRYAIDPTNEVLEVNFANEVLLNYIGLEIARYPCVAEISVQDPSGGWKVVNVQIIQESVPPGPDRIVPPGTVRRNRVHPTHPPDQSHWRKVSLTIPIQKAKGIRVQFVRINATELPRGGRTREKHKKHRNILKPSTYWRRGKVRNIPEQYSMAVRNFDVGIRIFKPEDVPEVPPDEPVSVICDVIETPGTLEIFRQSAMGLLKELPWRCEPQPIPDAVVNFIVDSRDEAGEAQLIDRFEIDPLYVGPHFHIYWSGDAANPDQMGANNDPLEPGQFDVEGTVFDNGRGISFSDSDPAWVDIQGSVLQFDITKPWWLGITLHPQFAHSTSLERPVIDLFGNLLSFDSGVLRFTNGNDTIEVETFFSEGEEIKLVLVYFPEAVDEFEAGWYLYHQTIGATGHPALFVTPPVHPVGPGQPVALLWTQGQSVVAEHVAVNNPYLNLANVIRVGGSLANIALVGAINLETLTLKQEQVTTATIQDFFSNPEPYSLKPLWKQDPITAKTNNALLRFHHDYLRPGTIGFVGGPGDIYSNLDWRPIPRDYVLTKGFVHLLPVKARFFKFEFTALAPVQMDQIAPMSRTCMVHTTPNVENTPPAVGGEGRWLLESGLGPDALIAPFPYEDRLLLERDRANPSIDPNVGYLPTQALAANDPVMRQQIDDQWVLRTAAWQDGAPDLSPIQPPGQHQYRFIRCQQDKKVAYYVGIKRITPYRVDYSAEDLTYVYIDKFWDNEQIALGSTWGFNPGYMYAIDNDNVAQGKPIGSARPIHGVQYATQQSNARQLVSNANFGDTSLLGSNFDDVDDWHVVGDANAEYILADRSVRVSREPQPQSRFIAGAGGIVQPLVSPVFAFRVGQFADTGLNAASFGGLQSGPVLVPPRGQVHAAIKIHTEESNATFSIQIVDPADDSVLATKDVSPTAGHTLEDYVSLELNEVGWTEVAIRVIQNGIITRTWTVEDFSLFDEGIVWDFSNDGGVTWFPALGIRNDPNGVLRFPTSGNSLTWRATGYREDMTVSSIQIRPWFDWASTTRRRAPRFGPNVSAYDQYPPIDEDPDFRQWRHPVPRRWWNAYRHLLDAITGGPLENPPLYYGRTIEETVSEPLFSLAYDIVIGRAIRPELPPVTVEMDRELVLERDVPITVPEPSIFTFGIITEDEGDVMRGIVSPPTGI